MPAPKEKLAESLKALQSLQDKDGAAIFRSAEITRTHKERLKKNGFITEVIKGWYISADPGEKSGSSTTWYTMYWKFCVKYLNRRFGKKWCLSPEQSIALHSGNWSIPKQLIVRSPKAGNNITRLILDTSIVDAVLTMPAEKYVVEINGIRIFSLPYALISCTSNLFITNPTDLRIVLAAVADESEVLNLLLEGGNSSVAGRIAGAFFNIGRKRIANKIMQTMKSAGYDVRISDPFQHKLQFSAARQTISPYINRIITLWHHNRETVLKLFPDPPGIPKNKSLYFKGLEESYKTDAYHSLSIEGYKVTHELIERVMHGKWDPIRGQQDKTHVDAMAARGYYLAFESVKKSIKQVLEGKNAGITAYNDHDEWYRQMFSPSVIAGLLKPSDLSGYRNGQVYISHSAHIPPSAYEVRHAMPAFFELLQKENEPSVRAVLGHFIFVYIHPYMDGNGRIARFLMNVMLASGGFPWTVIPFEKREQYMKALEKASVQQDISDFAKFLSGLVKARLKEKV